MTEAGASYISELARAKINLTLHVGAAIGAGQWAGYHPVESLVVFADFGDTLLFKPNPRPSLTFKGRFGKACADMPTNTIWAAFDRLDVEPMRVMLQKDIPIAAGLGGGTADAAAVLRVFDPEQTVDPVVLGADVPVCRLSQTAMMEGIGERLTPLPGLRQIAAVLVNPGVAVSTGAVFHALDSAPRPAVPATTARTGDLLSRALSGGNDMQDAAVAQVPIIGEVLRALAQISTCQLARMSGSGATCFGLFRSDAQAEAAATALAAAHPDWWVRACRLGDEDGGAS